MAFNMAVCGDSVLWGVGLEADQKIHSLVAKHLEGELKEEVVVQHYAQTGAKLVRGRDTSNPLGGGDPVTSGQAQETPHASPSVMRQVDQITSPESIDLVLVNGGANDVDVWDILDPRTARETIEQRSERYCQREMLNVLRRIGQRCPNARVIVLNYYPILSTESDVGVNLLGATMLVLGGGNFSPSAALSGALALKDPLQLVAENCSAWTNYSWQFLGKAVQAANREMDNRFWFTSAQFGKEHAMFAPSSRLFGLEWNARNVSPEHDVFSLTDPFHKLAATLGPVDGRRDRRRGICASERRTGWNLKICNCASAGHPNPVGAMVYKDAIVRQLDNPQHRTARPTRKTGIGR